MCLMVLIIVTEIMKEQTHTGPRNKRKNSDVENIADTQNDQMTEMRSDQMRSRIADHVTTPQSARTFVCFSHHIIIVTSLSLVVVTQYISISSIFTLLSR